jgi:hypothetical protein
MGGFEVRLVPRAVCSPTEHSTSLQDHADLLWISDLWRLINVILAVIRLETLHKMDEWGDA